MKKILVMDDDQMICEVAGAMLKAIGHEVCRRQGDVLFRSTQSLLRDLLNHSQPIRSARLLKKCLKVELLILDDFAFRKLDQKESEILYALADERSRAARQFRDETHQDILGIVIFQCA